MEPKRPTGTPIETPIGTPITTPTGTPTETPITTPITIPTETPIETPIGALPNNDNKQNFFKITTIVAAVIAICGIGFGVYSIIQSSQKDTQISDLKSQVSELEKTISDLSQTANETTNNNQTNSEYDIKETYSGDQYNPNTIYNISLNSLTGDFAYTPIYECGYINESDCQDPTTYNGVIPTDLLNQAVQLHGQIDFNESSDFSSAAGQWFQAISLLISPNDVVLVGCNQEGSLSNCSVYDNLKDYDSNHDEKITNTEYSRFLLLKHIPDLLQKTSE